MRTVEIKDSAGKVASVVEVGRSGPYVGMHVRDAGRTYGYVISMDQMELVSLIEALSRALRK